MMPLISLTGAEKFQMRWARLAGFLYLFTYAVPMAGWAIRGRFEVADNFFETAHRIAASELYYRFGLSCLILSWLLCIFLAMGLYAALKPVNSTLALFGLLFRLTENVLATAFSLLAFVGLRAYTSADINTVFSPKQLSAVIALISAADAAQFNLSMVFLGIGSAFFFYLFLKSRYIPKLLSIYSLGTTPIFTAVSFAMLLWPQYSSKLQYGWLPLALAEVSIGLWLLIKGVNLRSQPAIAATPEAREG